MLSALAGSASRLIVFLQDITAAETDATKKRVQAAANLKQADKLKGEVGKAEKEREKTAKELVAKEVGLKVGGPPPVVTCMAAASCSSALTWRPET